MDAYITKLLAESATKIDNLLPTFLKSAFLPIYKEVISSKEINQQELQQLQKDFKEFATLMAKSNMEALIDALNNVMREFNEKLTEQFGENFKELNMAVGQLLTWQEGYKVYITETEKHLSEVLSRFDSAQTSLEVVSNNAESLVNAGNLLSDSSQILNTEHKQLLENLEVMSTFKENISELPSNLKQVVSQLAILPEKVGEGHEKLMQSMGQTYESTSTAMQGHHEDLMQNIGQIYEKTNALMQNQHKDLVENMAQTYDNTSIAMQEHHEDLIKTSDTSIKKVETIFTESASKLEIITDQLSGNFSQEVQNNINNTINFVKNVEIALQEQLANILKDYGEKVTTISEKLIEQQAKSFKK